jgi:hypothetical protein
MNALDFLNTQDAKPGDVLVFKHDSQQFVGIVDARFGHGFHLAFRWNSNALALGNPPLLEDLEPIALYRASQLWDPEWWTPADRLLWLDLEVDIIARVAWELEEKRSLRDIAELVAENAELKRQLEKIREVLDCDD